MKLSLLFILLSLISSTSLGVSPVPSNLIGEWSTYFYKTSFAGVKSDIVISENSLQEKVEFIGALSIGAPNGQILRNSYIVSSTEPSTENQSTFIANIKVKKIEIAANGAWEAERMSQLSYCDINNWQPGRFYDVTGLRCKEFGSGTESWHLHPSAGEKSRKWIHYSESKLYIKNPIQPMNSNVSENEIDFDHPLFKISR